MSTSPSKARHHKTIKRKGLKRPAGKRSKLPPRKKSKVATNRAERFYIGPFGSPDPVKLRHDRNDRLWPEEELALDNIMRGKTGTVKQSGEQFLEELRSMINEQTSTAS